MIKVIIQYRIKPGKEKELGQLVWENRGKAMRQWGYISTETMKAVDDPLAQLTISTWISLEHWKAWANNPERRRIIDKVETMVTDRKEAIYTY